MQKTSGFSLIEVVVAGVIFTIAVAGIFASISAVRQNQAFSSTSPSEPGAAICGQELLEKLRLSVDGRWWNSTNNDYSIVFNTKVSELSTTTHNTGNTPLIATLASCSGYTVSYVVENLTPPNKSKKVTATIAW
jgi:Tfp pilus assembly protein PilV